ncbi:MAG: hypothetical protein OZSIB_2633 [Candidatus Ozemobacter sibiricus]|uniref:Uncharacterized protein n=1 Tax=Candidatus Ozemobacter sibiricus TaxID=2268124 RepID=A0A367ZRH6_9BACT|nr:MAG: hypothetical protein OZSIB_2633 [Candidatus Ozemobacter sibiricus]
MSIPKSPVCRPTFSNWPPELVSPTLGRPPRRPSPLRTFGPRHVGTRQPGVWR